MVPFRVQTSYTGQEMETYAPPEQLAASLLSK